MTFHDETTFTQQCSEPRVSLYTDQFKFLTVRRFLISGEFFDVIDKFKSVLRALSKVKWWSYVTIKWGIVLSWCSWRHASGTCWGIPVGCGDARSCLFGLGIPGCCHVSTVLYNLKTGSWLAGDNDTAYHGAQSTAHTSKELDHSAAGRHTTSSISHYKTTTLITYWYHVQLAIQHWMS